MHLGSSTTSTASNAGGAQHHSFRGSPAVQGVGTRGMMFAPAGEPSDCCAGTHETCGESFLQQLVKEWAEGWLGRRKHAPVSRRPPGRKHADSTEWVRPRRYSPASTCTGSSRVPCCCAASCPSRQNLMWLAPYVTSLAQASAYQHMLWHVALALQSAACASASGF
jgi:hypothetical protein